MKSVAELRREIARLLVPASPSAPLDARILVAHIVGSPPDQLALHDDEPADDETVAGAVALAERRRGGEPVARIIGEKEFYGLSFVLSPDTLVPRPDTETLVGAALAAIEEEWHRKATLSILDLGTGSGAILIALLSELPNSRGIGIDIAAGAVKVAAENAERHRLSERASFVVGDWTKKVRRRFEVVVANPPYIETGAIDGLPVEVKGYDPHVALDGGADGLDAVHAILSDLDRVLADGGRAFVEIGKGQADSVKALAEAHNFACRFERDLADVERVAVLSRQSEHSESNPGTDG